MSGPGGRTAKPFVRVLVAMAIVAGIFVLTEPANAYTLLGTGCRYDPSNDDDGLGIGIKTTDPLYNSAQALSTQNAAWGWNQVMAPQFTMVTYGGATMDLRVEWANLGANVGGVTYYSCGYVWWQNDPTFKWGANQTYYVTTSGRRTAIAEHEIGHSYGLDHNNTGLCNPTTAGIMYYNAVAKYDACAWNLPTIDDAVGAGDAHDG